MARTLAMLMLVLLAPVARGQEPGSAGGSDLEKLAQQRIDAYNAHDAEAMQASTAPDAEWSILGSDAETVKGHDAIVARTKETFEREPEIRLSVADRKVYGDLVVQRFRFTGGVDDPETPAVEPPEGYNASVILVRDGKVQRIWVIQSAETGASSSELENLAQQRIDAFNAHDAEAMQATTAPDAEWSVLGSDEPPVKGHDAIVAQTKETFAREPEIRLSVADRKVYGDLVVQRFQFTGGVDDPDTPEVEPSEGYNASVILVRDGKVQKIWIIPAGASARQ